jgi:hypothetical protein
MRAWVVLPSQSEDPTIRCMMVRDAKRELLRHFLATLAYRCRKVILGTPKNFGNFDAGYGVRKPREILSHMSGVLLHAHSFLTRVESSRMPLGTWEEEVWRFFQILSELDKSLESGMPWNGRTEERILQGPLADAMTHIGQLAMLRRMASSPISKENFDEAAIRLGDVSPPVSG